MSAKITTKEQAQEFLDKYEWFLFDCDGVIWLGDHLLPHVVETIELLQKNKKHVLFVTNNSTKSRNDYLSKFEKFGIHITKNEIFGSSFASAIYIEQILKLPKNKKVWVLGERGIEQELHELGYETVGGTDPRLEEKFDSDHELVNNLDPDVGAVLVGLTPNLNYLKMSATLQYLQKKDVHFIATNIDSTYPLKGKILPGAGSIIQSVAYAAGREPEASCGKPNQAMLDAIVSAHKFERSTTVMVGDRLNTDMKFGRDGGLGTLLVLTGIETEQGVLSQPDEIAPLNYMDKLGDLFELLN